MAKLEIGALASINEILDRLDFLEYSTQKRNLAYRLQFQDFLFRIYENYEMYGSIETTFIRNFCDLTTNILECLIWIVVSQELSRCPETKQQLRKLAQKSGIISKELSGKIGKIFGKRDKLHPSKQEDLDTKIFEEKDFFESFEVTNLLIASLKKYFHNNELPPARMESDFCDYCSPDGPFRHDDFCPACGEPIRR